MTVTGEGRQIAVVLIHPSGQIVTWTELRNKTARLTIFEVVASDAHKVGVFSNCVGSISPLVTGPADEELGAKGLEAKIAKLKRERKDAEALLKALTGEKS